MRAAARGAPRALSLQRTSRRLPVSIDAARRHARRGLPCCHQSGVSGAPAGVLPGATTRLRCSAARAGPWCRTTAPRLACGSFRGQARWIACSERTSAAMCSVRCSAGHVPGYVWAARCYALAAGNVSDARVEPCGFPRLRRRNLFRLPQ